jgi:hypothetical protein
MTLLEYAFDKLNFEGNSEHLHQYVVDCFRKLAPQRTRRSYTMLFQSSGWGKSRQAVELCKLGAVDGPDPGKAGTCKYLYLFCCIRQENQASTGYPPPAKKVIDFFERIQRSKSTMEEAIMRCRSFLLAAFHLAEAEYDPNASDRQSSSFWDRVISRAEEKNPDEKKVNDQYCTVLFLDEANTLVDMTIDLKDEKSGSIERLSMFRVLRRSILKLPLSIQGLVIFSDTSSRLHAFLPPMTLDPSYRSDSGSDYDVLPPYFQLPNSESLQNQDFTTLGTYCYGRPLWKAFISSGIEQKCRVKTIQSQILLFAAEKLVRFKSPFENYHHLIEANKLKPTVTVALLGVRLGLHVCPFSQLAREIVSGNLATVLAVDSERFAILVDYISEPVLADASSLLLTLNSFNLWRESLSSLRALIGSGLVSAGEVGELVARIALLLLRDYDRKKKQQLVDDFGCNDSRTFCSSVCDFLRPLDVLEGDFNGLKDCEVNFTHFSILHSEFMINEASLKDLWDRACAISFVRNHPHWDFLIPIREKKKSFRYMLVQVKNFKSHKLLSDESFEVDVCQLLNKLVEASSSLKSEVQPLVCMYLDVGATESFGSAGDEKNSEPSFIPTGGRKYATRLHSIEVPNKMFFIAVHNVYPYLQNMGDNDELKDNFANIVESMRDLVTRYQHPVFWFSDNLQYERIKVQDSLSFSGRLVGAAKKQHEILNKNAKS